MKTSNDVIGKPVITMDEGIRLGSVEDLLFDENQSRLLGLFVKPGMLGEPFIVNFSDIAAFSPDALISRSQTDASDARAAQVYRHAAMQGKRVVTRDGRDLGTVKDLYFDELGGEILGYELAHSAFGSCYPGDTSYLRARVSQSAPTSCSSNPEAADLLERKGAALKDLDSRADSARS